MIRSTEMLQYIDASGHAVTLSVLPGSSFWLDSVDGLGGLEAEMYTARGDGQDGETVVGVGVKPRIVTIDGTIWRGIAAPLGRQLLLRAFNPRSWGRLIYTDTARGIRRYLVCRVQQAPVFSVSAMHPAFQVVLFAAYPYWRDGDGLSQMIADIALWLGDIQFGGMELSAQSELGHRSPSLIVNVYNGGDVPAGVDVEWRALASTSDPALINVQTQEQISLTLDLIAGDVLRIRTGYREKSAVLTRSGVATNVFNLIDPGSDWIQLHPGDNLLRYDASVTDNVEVTIRYDNAYLGV